MVAYITLLLYKMSEHEHGKHGNLSDAYLISCSRVVCPRSFLRSRVEAVNLQLPHAGYKQLLPSQSGTETDWRGRG